MKILIRLPNWLGDMVMSTAFVRAVRASYPAAEIDVIVKKDLDTLVDLMPWVSNRYIFSKSEWRGLRGAYRFGKKIKRRAQYDLFFCLPDSFSSAFMGWATGAKRRIGFRKELRSMFLTNVFRKPVAAHRVDEYIHLLEQFKNEVIASRSVVLTNDQHSVRGRIILNFNSEVESRRIPVDKAVSILEALMSEIPSAEFVTIGSAKENAHVEAILKRVQGRSAINNKAGQTPDLSTLAKVIGSGAAMFTSDSGPAHLANALGVPVVVTFGAGNEMNTAPYNTELVTVLRLGQLPCEPCLQNICKFGLPKCLELLEINRIVSAVKNLMT